MKLRTVALPSGVFLFLLGLLYAGTPPETQTAWGVDFGISSEVRLIAGLASFALGSFLMWMGKEDFSENRFFGNAQIESTEIRRILSERKRRES